MTLGTVFRHRALGRLTKCCVCRSRDQTELLMDPGKTSHEQMIGIE